MVAGWARQKAGPGRRGGGRGDHRAGGGKGLGRRPKADGIWWPQRHRRHYEGGARGAVVKEEGPRGPSQFTSDASGGRPPRPPDAGPRKGAGRPRSRTGPNKLGGGSKGPTGYTPPAPDRTGPPRPPPYR